jgi:GTP-binding protein YchF
MRIALLGLQGAGKTTVFNAIAESPVDQQPGVQQLETHVQIVKMHDPRLEACRDLFSPKKYTPTGLEVWDAPGLPPGAGEADRERRSKILTTLREADAYVLVVREFRSDQYPYDRPQPDARADLERLADEMMTADFVIAEKRAEKLRASINKKTKTAAEDALELAILEQCLERFEAGKNLGDLELDAQNEKRIRGFQFFTRKPVMVLVNGPDEAAPGLADGLAVAVQGVAAMDAQIDAELNAMDPEDRPEFMEEFGIDAPAADRFVRDVYGAVGLRSFFTVGEDEVRAWTIHAGDTAVIAAGKIHTDLAKGFVRAEVYAHETLLDAGSERELKARNGIRLEAKDYVVQDGDVVHIRSAM